MAVTYAEVSEILDAFLARSGPPAPKVCASIALALAEHLDPELTQAQRRIIAGAKRHVAGQLPETERVALVCEQGLAVEHNVKADRDETKSGAIDRLVWGSLLDTTRLDQESASYLLDWAEVASIPANAALATFATQLDDLNVRNGAVCRRRPSAPERPGDKSVGWRAGTLSVKLCAKSGQQTMSKSLELRPTPYIVAGYVCGPLIGLTVMWLFWIVPSVVGPPFQWRQALAIWLFMNFIGGAICLAFELVVVTPILIGFRRHRWRWLNGWTAMTLGFLAGAALAMIIGSLPPPPGSSEAGQYGVAYVIDGVRTSAGLKAVFVGALQPGVVGAVAALVFRLVAVRSVQNTNVA